MPGGDEGILSEDPPVAEDGGADIPAFCAVDVMRPFVVVKERRETIRCPVESRKEEKAWIKF